MERKEAGKGASLLSGAYDSEGEEDVKSAPAPSPASTEKADGRKREREEETTTSATETTEPNEHTDKKPKRMPSRSLYGGLVPRQTLTKRPNQVTEETHFQNR